MCIRKRNYFCVRSFIGQFLVCSKEPVIPSMAIMSVPVTSDDVALVEVVVTDGTPSFTPIRQVLPLQDEPDLVVVNVNLQCPDASTGGGIEFRWPVCDYVDTQG